MDCFFVYDGIIAAQTKDIDHLFDYNFLTAFDVIIEIGANRGGLTKYIADTINGVPYMKFYSYEIDPSNLLIPSDYISPNKGEIFLQTWVGHIDKLLEQSKGKRLILCDGGNKEEEFNSIVPLLRSGDQIMLHDYTNGTNLVDFTRNGWYSQPEALYANIEQTVIKYNLQELKHSLKYLWGAFAVI